MIHVVNNYIFLSQVVCVRFAPIVSFGGADTGGVAFGFLWTVLCCLLWWIVGVQRHTRSTFQLER